MGTPDFARTILERLVADGHDVCGVFTQPDKPRNRNKVTPSPVKEYALSQNIPVFQPVTMRDGTALEDFKTLAPELAVVPHPAGGNARRAGAWLHQRTRVHSAEVPRRSAD